MLNTFVGANQGAPWTWHICNLMRMFSNLFSAHQCIISDTCCSPCYVTIHPLKPSISLEQYVSQDISYITQSDSFFLHASFSFNKQVHSCMMVHHKWISHSSPLQPNTDLWVFWLTGSSSLRSSSLILKSPWHSCTLWVV